MSGGRLQRPADSDYYVAPWSDGFLQGDLFKDVPLPADNQRSESAALLYMPITVHHDVVAEERVAQLTGTAFWHLRVKLMAFYGGFLLDPRELGESPAPQARTI